MTSFISNDFSDDDAVWKVCMSLLVRPAIDTIVDDNCNCNQTYITFTESC